MFRKKVVDLIYYNSAHKNDNSIDKEVVGAKCFKFKSLISPKRTTQDFYKFTRVGPQPKDS